LAFFLFNSSQSQHFLILNSNFLMELLSHYLQFISTPKLKYLFLELKQNLISHFLLELLSSFKKILIIINLYNLNLFLHKIHFLLKNHYHSSTFLLFLLHFLIYLIKFFHLNLINPIQNSFFILFKKKNYL
jgi:hypothetical protein